MALKAADAAVAAASEGEKFAPEQWKALTESVKSAHQKFESGDYAGAKTAAEAATTAALDVTKAAAEKKAEVTKAWSALQASVPAAGDALRSKLEALAAMKKLPKGLDKTKLDEAKAGLAEFEKVWSEAGQAAQAGDLVAALAKAQAASAKALEAGNLVGLGVGADQASAAGTAAAKK